MAAEGVQTRGMRIDPMARTTMNIMAQPDANHYDCLFYRNPGADTLLRPDELDVELLCSTRAFHFASLSLTDEPSRSAALEAARIARQAGALVSFDVNYRPTLWQNQDEAMAYVTSTIPLAHVLKVNEGELALLSEQELALDAPGWEDRIAEASRSLIAKGPMLIIVTLGPGGAFYQTYTGSGFVPGFSVRTIDATGCGDAFIAGLLWQLVRDRPALGGSAALPAHRPTSSRKSYATPMLWEHSRPRARVIPTYQQLRIGGVPSTQLAWRALGCAGNRPWR
jgi:fructokinase